MIHSSGTDEWWRCRERRASISKSWSETSGESGFRQVALGPFAGKLPASLIDLALIGAVQIDGPGVRARGNHAVLATVDPTQTSSSSQGTAMVVVELTTGKLWRVSRGRRDA